MYLKLAALATLTLSLKLIDKAKDTFAHTVTSKQKPQDEHAMSNCFVISIFRSSYRHVNA